MLVKSWQNDLIQLVSLTEQLLDADLLPSYSSLHIVYWTQFVVASGITVKSPVDLQLFCNIWVASN